MAEHGLRRLPVIDRDHHLVGIIKLADLQGESTSVKKALKVVFQKDKRIPTAQAPLKTFYITGVKTREAAEAAALKRVEEEHGNALNKIADHMEVTEEP